MYPGTESKNGVLPPKAAPLVFKPNNTVSAKPSVSIAETETGYLITVSIPGLQRENFSIRIEKDTIAVSAKKQPAFNYAIKGRHEYDYVEWANTFVLPENADADLAHAKYKNGELIIRIPRGNTIGSKETTSVCVF